MVCIDSDILIDFLRKKQEAIQLLTSFEARDGTLQTTTINSFEIFKGIAKHTNSEKYAEVVEFFSRFSFLDFDFKASQKAAEIYEDLKLKGLMLDTGDLLIAAIVI